MPSGASAKRTAPAWPRPGLIPCKRRKRRAGASDAAPVVEGSECPPWATLDSDLLRLVAWRVLAADFTDYVRLRAVCCHWRSSTVCPRGRSVVDPRFHPRHWMLLPEGYRLYPGHTKLRGFVRFFNLRTGSFSTVRLPLFRDHFVMDSADGILVLQRDHDMAVRLFHPFTGDIVELPSLATLFAQVAALFTPFERRGYKDAYLFNLTRGVSAAVTYSPNGLITAMLALTSNHVRRIAFATSEDQQWTLSSWETNSKSGLLSSQGKLYFTDCQRQVFMVDPPQPQYDQHGGKTRPPSLQPPKLIATCPRDKVSFPLCLVECDSQILLVSYMSPSRPDAQVYRLTDAILGRFVPLKCIGGNSLFTKGFRSLCVSSKLHPSIMGDSVLRISHGSRHLCQYHLGSGTWSAATDGDIFEGPIPSPYSIIHHIYACCHRSYWNKGLIYCPTTKLTWGVKEKWRVGG